MTIQSLIKRLSKLTTGYKLKSSPKKNLVEKLRSFKGVKKSKQPFKAAFFVAADGFKVQSQLLFGKANYQNVLRTYRTRLEQVWCITRLQPLDAGIIRAFKCKYRKLLMKCVVSQIDEGKKASEII